MDEYILVQHGIGKVKNVLATQRKGIQFSFKKLKTLKARLIESGMLVYYHAYVEKVLRYYAKYFSGI